MTGLPALLLSILMIAAFLLTWGGITLIRRGTDRKKGILMLLCAAVLLLNVAIWTV